MEHVCNPTSYEKIPLFAESVRAVIGGSFFPPRSLWEKVGLSEAGTEIHVISSEFVKAMWSLWWHGLRGRALLIDSVVFPHRCIIKSLKYTLYSFKYNAYVWISETWSCGVKQKDRYRMKKSETF